MSLRGKQQAPGCRGRVSFPLTSATYAPGTYAAITGAYAAAGDPDKTASARRLAENETLLTGFAGMTPADQAVTLDKLEPSPVRDQARRIKEASNKMLARDPLLWGTTTQRANGVGELVPLDLTSSPTNTPQAIVAALGQRARQARRIELLLPSPAMTEAQIAEVSRLRLLPMTREEIVAFKRMLDETPPAQQSKLILPLAGLSPEPIPGMAQALAGGDSGGDKSVGGIQPAVRMPRRHTPKRSHPKEIQSTAMEWRPPPAAQPPGR